MKKLPLSIMKKLLLSILLSLCMVLTMPPIAFAAGTVDIDGTDISDGTVGTDSSDDTVGTDISDDTDGTVGTDISDDVDGTDSSNGTDGTDSSDDTGGTDSSDGTDISDDTDGTDSSDDTDGTDSSDDTDGTDSSDDTDGTDSSDDTDGTVDMDGTVYMDVTDDTGSTDGPATSFNIHQQNYMLYQASTIKSYLFENESGGLTRVDYPALMPSGTMLVPSYIIVEEYDSDFVFQRSYSIPSELTTMGGFFAGKDYNFFVFGQYNYYESDDVEVIRVVKYSKDWKRLGQVSLYGENTTEPFHATLRFAEYNGDLYIHTSHKMYRSSDDVNHQANMNILVRESDMTVLDVSSSFHSVMGGVGHSFNQFVIVDQQQRIVTLDHGDANPRSAVLMEYTQKAGEGNFSGVNRRVDVQAFPMNNTEYQRTGASLGGLAETSGGYVITYNYDGAGQSITAADRNVYLAYVDKDSFSVEKKAISTSVGNTTPVLVPTGLDGGYILWNESDDKGNGTDTLHYVTYSDGCQVGEIKTATAPLSDCQPIVYGDKIVWYVTEDTVPAFYQLDESGVTRTPLKQLTEDMFEVETTEVAYTGSAITRSIIGKDGKRTLVQDIDYTADYTNNTEEGEATITITGIGSYAGTLTYTFTIVKLKSLTEDMFTVSSADEIYSGRPFRKTITGKDGDKTLVQDTHYTVTYANNSAIGTATITITGIGIYTGTLTYTFNIVESKALTEDMFIVDTTDEIYTGRSISKTIIAKDGLNSKYYVVAYYNSAAIGTATISISGSNGYTGTLKYTFKIVKQLDSFMFKFNKSDEIYTGKAITKTITGKSGDRTLVQDTDYTVEYANNTNIGTATITITGIGYFFGTLTYTFNIKAAVEITAATVNGDQVVVTINTNKSQSALLVAAFYQNGKMTALVTDVTDVVPKADEEYRLNIPSGAKGQQCKVFLLNRRTLAPLSPSWEAVYQ